MKTVIVLVLFRLVITVIFGVGLTCVSVSGLSYREHTDKRKSDILDALKEPEEGAGK